LTAYLFGSAAYPLLSGAGAAGRDDVRWNSRGRFIIYCAEHYATALLEQAAQLNSVRIPRTLLFIRVDVPDESSVEEVRPEDLRGWDADDKTVSQRFGDRWYDERRSLILFVPSLAAPGLERNMLINQEHPQFASVAGSASERVRCHPKLLV
jgi:RES domain-containing protein